MLTHVSPQQARRGSRARSARRPRAADRGVRGGREDVVGERSAQIHTSGAPVERGAAHRAPQRPRRERRERRRRSMPAVALATLATGPSRSIRLTTGATGAVRSAQGGAGPAGDGCADGGRLHVVLLVQRLGLVGRHVHTGRAVRHAALARQAQVQRLGTAGSENPATGVRRAPPAAPASAPGGVLLLPRREVRRAHHPTAVASAATHFADAGAPVAPRRRAGHRGRE